VVPDFGGDDCTVIVYENTDFTGWQAQFSEGSFNMNSYLAKGAVNDDASAIRVRGQDCKATFFQHADFSGWAAGPFDEGDYDLTYLEGSSDFVNDDMSSLKVVK
jgi:hypothetical protein